MKIEGDYIIAVAYYNGSSAEDKQLARHSFSKLDGDGNGRVSLAEFQKVIGSDDSTNIFFAAFDQNGDGDLDFEEFLTLYYTFKVKMRGCSACNELLLGSYFSCVLCEKDFPKSYDLCCACYGGGKFRHHHSADKFLDDRSMRNLFVYFLKQQDSNTVSSSSRNSSMENMKNILDTGKMVVELVNGFGNLAKQTDDGCIIM